MKAYILYVFSTGVALYTHIVLAVLYNVYAPSALGSDEAILYTEAARKTCMLVLKFDFPIQVKHSWVKHSYYGQVQINQHTGNAPGTTVHLGMHTKV